MWCREEQNQDPNDYMARRRCRIVPSDPCDCECWTHSRQTGNFQQSPRFKTQAVYLVRRKGVLYLKDLKSSTNSTKLMMLSEIMSSWKPLKQPFPRPCQLRLLQALRPSNTVSSEANQPLLQVIQFILHHAQMHSCHCERLHQFNISLNMHAYDVRTNEILYSYI